MDATYPVEQVWRALAETVHDLEERQAVPTGAIVKSRAQVALGRKIVESSYGFRSFSQLAKAAANAGYVSYSRKPGDSDFVLRSRGYEFVVLAEVVEHIIERGGRPIGLHVKPLLTDALGGSFQHAALGHRTFKEFCLAAQAAGWVTVSVDPDMPDFELATVPKTPSTDAAPPAELSHTDAEPTMQRESSGAVNTRREAPMPLEDAFEAIRAVVVGRHDNGKGTDAAGAKDLLVRAYPNFDQSAIGYTRFKDFLGDAEQAGYLQLRDRPGHGRSVTDLYPPAPLGVSFADIRWGYASAGAESVRDPALLLEGFYDADDVAKKVIDGSEYIVLGHKGSGKSAIGEHLVQRSDIDPTLFVDLIDLKDFPYGTLSQLAADDSSQQLLRLSWRWLLLLRVFQYMLSDNGADAADVDECERLERALAKQQLIPSRSLTELSLRSVSVALKGGLPSVYEGSLSAEFTTRQVQLTEAVGRLEDIVSRFSTNNRHIHIIDGLDELLSPDDRTYASLSALLGEVESLNDVFHRAKSAAKVIMLCRSDLYERLTSPNKNKIRQNFAVSLRWSTATDDEETASLEGLLLQRARLSGYVGDSPIRDLLPLAASLGGKAQVDMWVHLVEHTRKTPRDLIALLTKIQRKAGRATITMGVIQKALNDYSTEYFVPELKDELQGYLQPEHIDEVFGLLSALRRRVFQLAELDHLARARRLDLPLLEAVQILFDCSAIGRGMTAESKSQVFRFDNPNLSVNPEEPLVVHRGAWWALNLTS